MSARILAVDDNAANLELMLYLLRAFGYTADGVADGLAALEACSGASYEAVLSDVLMPGIDGYELARRLKDEGFRGPLIAVTALAMVGDRDRLLSAGFDGYISKPIDPERFVAQLESHLAPELRARGERDGDDPRR